MAKGPASGGVRCCCILSFRFLPCDGLVSFSFLQIVLFSNLLFMNILQNCEIIIGLRSDKIINHNLNCPALNSNIILRCLIKIVVHLIAVYL